MRSQFTFEVEILGCILDGLYAVEDGRVEQLTFGDGTTIETTFGGMRISAGNRSPLETALAQYVLDQLNSHPVYQDEINRTKPVIDWTPYAPVVI